SQQKLGGQKMENADQFWYSLREQTHHFFAADDDGEHVLWRASLPSAAPALKLRGKSLIEWGGAQRWLWTNEPEDYLRDIVQAAGGHLTQFRHGTNRENVFTKLAPAVHTIHRKLKAGFDPVGIFNPRRLFPE
ncbi:MAG: glycolate oxidase subunit GlcE, partial [Undibacterium sp.]|nr:glycolate oxidase subunit GlcE [Undibacterium sp.]